MASTNEKVNQAWESRVKLYAEGNKLQAECRKPYAESRKLHAESRKLYAEGDLIFYNAVIEVFGPKAVIMHSSNPDDFEIS